MGKNKSSSGGNKVQPFALFCSEQKQTRAEFRNLGMPQLFSDKRISDMWTSLSVVDKQRYVQMAKEFNNQSYAANAPMDTNVQGRFDSFGRSMLAKQQEDALAKYNQSVMIADIVQRVQLAHDKGELPTMKINVMSINAWLEDSDIITPAEIGIVQFNLEQGILKVLDQLVDPGVIPKGYRGDMKVISDKFHKIWLDNPDLSDDYEGIINAIQDFMKRDTHSLIERAAGEGITVEGRFQPGKDLIEEQTKRRIENRNQDYLPVFVMPGVMMERCIRCMDWLAVKAQVPCEFTFFELPRLFYEILRVLSSNRTFRNISVPTLTIAEAHLNKDVLLYTPGVSCSFHEKAESSHCAAAMSLRHAFIICDFGCQLLHIEPIFGSHVPNLYDNKSMSYCDTTALDNTSTFGTSFSSHMSFLSGHSGFSTWDTDHQMHRHLPPRSNTPGSWKRGATVGSRHLHILDGMVKENVDRAGFIYYTLNPCIPESQSASGSVSRGSRTGSEAYGTVTENLENSFLTAGDGSEYSYA